MKRGLCLVLLVISTISFGTVLDSAKKKVKQIAKGAKATIKNPRKVARDVAKEAIKKVGVNINGIVANVNSVQSSVGMIKKDVDFIQQAMNAPKSPFSKLKSIVQNMDVFQKDASNLLKDVGTSDLKKALSDAAALDTVVEKLTTNKQQDSLRNLYKTYDSLIFDIDSVEMMPTLQHTRKMLYDVAGMLDSTLRIRDYSGTLAKILVSKNVASSIREISGSLRKVAVNLNGIIQGGSLSLKSVQGELASSLIANRANINKLVSFMMDNAKAVKSKMSEVRSRVSAMTRAKNKLIVAASSIGPRLEQTLLKKIKTVVGVFDIPRAAAVELTVTIKRMKTHLDAILKNAADALVKVADGMQSGANSVNAFKTYIKFDVVSPQVRADLNELPSTVRELSRNVTRLSKAIP